MKRRALIIGATGGIGQALIEGLRDWEVTALSRSGDGLDICDEASVRSAAEALTGPFDLIINATGALVIDGIGPERLLSEITPEGFAAQFALNATGPALLIKHFSGMLSTDRRAVFVTLSARVGSITDNRLGGWYAYRAAKAAQNQIVRSAAVELARKNPAAILVALHPGTVATDLTRAYLGRHRSVTADEAASDILNVIKGLTPAQSGGFFDQHGKVIPW